MNVCVFCGSSVGSHPVYAAAAKDLGIYGGGNVGLMGIVADAVMAHGGEVIGVIPDFLLKREVGHRGITQLEVVESMHQRKKRMADLADAFIAMPGGWGTLEELAEVMTWRQLGLVKKPIGILNVNNFFDLLLDQLRKMVQEGFVRQEWMDLLKVETSSENLLTSIRLSR
jgi:uncharacterized protein (TIGR00730 family)